MDLFGRSHSRAVEHAVAAETEQLRDRGGKRRQDLPARGARRAAHKTVEVVGAYPYTATLQTALEIEAKIVQLPERQPAQGTAESLFGRLDGYSAGSRYSPEAENCSRTD
jgi:hypothetical protein